MISASIYRFLTICLFFNIACCYSATAYSSGDIDSHRIDLDNYQMSVFKKFHTKWILDYMQSWCYQDTESDDVIQFAAQVKRKVQKFTHNRQHYSTLFREVHKKMKKRRIKLHRHYFDRITTEIRRYEHFLEDTNKNEMPLINFEVMGMSDNEIKGCVGVFCSVLLADTDINNCEYMSGIAMGIGIDSMMKAKVEGDLDEDLIDD